VIIPGLRNVVTIIRQEAIHCLALYCLLDFEAAMKYLHLFFEAIRTDVLAIEMTAISVLFDLLVFFGPKMLASTESSGIFLFHFQSLCFNSLRRH
jgi:hypothetical protein